MRILLAILLLASVVSADVKMSVNTNGVYLYDEYYPYPDNTNFVPNTESIIVNALGINADTNAVYIDDAAVEFVHLPQGSTLTAPTSLNEYSSYQCKLYQSWTHLNPVDVTAASTWVDQTDPALTNVTISNEGLITVGERDTTNTFSFIAVDGSWDDTADVTIYGAPNFLPAVSTNGVPAVDLSGFDAYAWAGTTNSPDTDAPAIAEWTRQGDSGDTIALTGEDL